MKNNKHLKSFLTCISLVLFICGCATLPAGERIPAYSISGTTYYPLVSICELKGIDLQYDALTRTAVLTRDANRVSLRPGDALILVNEQTMHLKYPVDIYRGTVVVPRQFKEQVVDVFFKSPQLAARAAGATIKLKKIVIDAGHGGNDPGAIGRTGLREKDVNLDIAKRLNSLLKQEGISTVLTRSSDRFIPLPIRVNIANKSAADLFVSVHSNAARSRSLSGFEVYYVSPTVSDARRASAAARSARLDLKDSVFAGSSQDLKTIVWDMIYTNNRAESMELSSTLCRNIGKSLDTKVLGSKPARFEVLRGIRMPGVLVETGFVSNPAEERLLKSGAYRQKLAEGILESIRDYSQDMALIEISAR